MLTAHVPMALALLATALMAVVIFAPAAARADVTISPAPPLPPTPFSAFESGHASADGYSRSDVFASLGDPFVTAGDAFASPGDSSASHGDAFASAGDSYAPAAGQHSNAPTWTAPCDEPVAPFWPVLVDARAARCGAADRVALASALGAVRAPWADAILRRALDDEPDPFVREALAAALRTAAALRPVAVRDGGERAGEC
jgi:hypothetical protein